MQSNGHKPKITTDEILAVGCKTCGAPAGKPCRVPGQIIVPLTYQEEQTDFSFHAVRTLMAMSKLAYRRFGEDLKASEKALITYYAFVMLAESVSANSVAIMGKHYPPEAVEAFFAHAAIEELKKDGLLR